MKRKPPAWPLLLRRDLAATACDLTVALFERGVLEGTLPQPIIVAGVELWSQTALTALGSDDSGDTDNWRDAQRRLNHAA